MYVIFRFTYISIHTYTHIYICVLLLKLRVFLVDFQYQSQNFIRYFFHPLLPPPYVFVCKIFCIFILVCSSCILHVAFQRCFQCSVAYACVFSTGFSIFSLLSVMPKVTLELCLDFILFYNYIVKTCYPFFPF